MNFEYVLMKSLFTKQNIFAIVYPTLKYEYFEDVNIADVYSYIGKYLQEYKDFDLKKFITWLKNKTQDKEIFITIKSIIDTNIPQDEGFLLKELEKYVKKQALKYSIIKSADLLQKDKTNYENILGMVEESLAITFDTNVGMEIDDVEKVEKYNNNVNRKISTGLECLDKALGGGFETKRLHVFLGTFGSGKTNIKIFLTSQFIQQKKNGIYFTLEMVEEEIAIRIYASLTGIPINQIKKMNKEEIKFELDKIKDKGKLWIKEYPVSTLNALQIESIIDKVEAKEGIKIDYIVVDYLGLMASSRTTLQKAGGTYMYFKMISEELHSLAKKKDIIVLTSHQLNRSAYNKELNEVSAENISDSFGINATADTMIAIVTNEKMRENNLQAFKFEKNRQTGFLRHINVTTDFSIVRYGCVDEMGVENKIKEARLENLIPQTQDNTIAIDLN